MQKLSLAKFRLHLDIERLPTVALYATLAIATLCLLGAGWFTYRKVYVPYVDDTVPEEKLTQKQDKLNVKDFDDASAKLEQKQKVPSPAVTIDPFATRAP